MQRADELVRKPINEHGLGYIGRNEHHRAVAGALVITFGPGSTNPVESSLQSGIQTIAHRDLVRVGPPPTSETDNIHYHDRAVQGRLRHRSPSLKPGSVHDRQA